MAVNHDVGGSIPSRPVINGVSPSWLRHKTLTLVFASSNLATSVQCLVVRHLSMTLVILGSQEENLFRKSAPVPNNLKNVVICCGVREVYGVALLRQCALLHPVFESQSQRFSFN